MDDTIDAEMQDALNRIELLTPSEREIARMVAAGMRARDIAAVRGTKVGCVRMHLLHIYRKLELRGGCPSAKLAARWTEHNRVTR